MTKQALLEALTDMPENISVDELMEKAVLIEKIEKGLEQSNSGAVFSTEEAKQRLSKWLK